MWKKQLKNDRIQNDYFKPNQTTKTKESMMTNKKLTHNEEELSTLVKFITDIKFFSDELEKYHGFFSDEYKPVFQDMWDALLEGIETTAEMLEYLTDAGHGDILEKMCPMIYMETKRINEQKEKPLPNWNTQRLH